MGSARIPGCAAAILVGGAGRRLDGVRKPLLAVGGRPVLELQLAVLTPLFDEIVLCADEAAPFAAFGRRVVVDRAPGLGPLEALAGALRSVAAPAVFVVAGDMPHLCAAAVARTVEPALAENPCDLAVPLVGGYPEPLHACYRRSCRPAVERALAAGRLQVTGFYDEVRVAWIAEEDLRRIDPTLGFLCNLNRPGDVASATATSSRTPRA